MTLEPWGIDFTGIELSWNGAARGIKALYFGVSPMTEKERQATFCWDAESWNSWRSEGYCVPGAKSNPGQSFWRCWDMGHAVLPLGSFGPAMGTPYVAAFPRPSLAAGLGGDAGWLIVGPGDVPSAAVSLDIKGTCACLRYLFREDIYTPPEENPRFIDKPLRLLWNKDAWFGFRDFYRTFPSPEPAPSRAHHSQLGTWGSFKEKIYDLDREHRRCVNYGFENVQLDDGWEVWKGSGVANESRFPNLAQFLNKIHSENLKIGLWQSIGWVAEPDAVGLSEEDLICGPDGKPRLASWNFDPASDQAIYCLDPSSSKARAFLAERTKLTIRRYRPDLIKLDFGYGLPGPDAGSPRNPIYRGERLCLELLRIIAEAAKEEDPNVMLEYYGIHPLYRRYYQIVSLDDIGDMGFHEIDGHHQRSVWAALTADQGAAIMATSGYYWASFEEILLNTAVLGVPGLCVAEVDHEGARASSRIITRMRALNRWHRRGSGWKPLWLNSCLGNLQNEPRLHCWGRIEGESRLTALALRDGPSTPALTEWNIDDWTGRWAVISLDDEGIDKAGRVACIPFDVGSLKWQDCSHQLYRVKYVEGQVLEESITPQSSMEVRSPEELESVMGFILERRA